MPIPHIFPFFLGFFHKTSLCIHDTRSAICRNKLIRYTLFTVHELLGLLITSVRSFRQILV